MLLPLLVQNLGQPVPPIPVSFFKSRGGHWTIRDCGSYFEIQESGAHYPAGSATLVNLLSRAKANGISVTLRRV